MENWRKPAEHGQGEHVLDAAIAKCTFVRKYKRAAKRRVCRTLWLVSESVCLRRTLHSACTRRHLTVNWECQSKRSPHHATPRITHSSSKLQVVLRSLNTRSQITPGRYPGDLQHWWSENWTLPQNSFLNTKTNRWKKWKTTYKGLLPCFGKFILLTGFANWHAVDS